VLHGIDKSRFKVTGTGSGFEVIPLQGLFATGDSWSPGARERVVALAETLARQPIPVEVRIIGHTDSIPFRSDKWGNEVLSARRAVAARAAFAEVANGRGNHTEMEMRGAENPPYSNGPEQHAANRTVTFRVAPIATTTCDAGGIGSQPPRG
jgi:flagellar motor protein MotB